MSELRGPEEVAVSTTTHGPRRPSPTRSDRRCRADGPTRQVDDLGFRLATGDPDAIRALYRRYGGRVFALAMRLLGDRGAAEDAAQETFLRIWRFADSFDADRDLDRWVLRIARNTAYDLGRVRSRQREAGGDPEPALGQAVEHRPHGRPDELAAAASTAWELRGAIDALPEVERDVVRLQHLCGLTHREIAEQLGVSVGTIKSRSHRAHRRLAAAMTTATS